MCEADTPQSGRVTSLRAQAGAPGRFSVFIDGAFAFGINQDVLLEFGLKKGIELSVDVQRAILEREAHFKARSTALGFLAYRDRSEEEVRRRLERSGYSESAIEETVTYLIESGLLDDETFAVSYAEGRFRSGGYGPMRIRHDLRRKGVRPSAVERAVDRVFGNHDEQLSTALELGRRRWERLSGEKDDRKRRKKVFGYLVRRGFTHAMVRDILDELS